MGPFRKSSPAATAHRMFRLLFAAALVLSASSAALVSAAVSADGSVDRLGLDPAVPRGRYVEARTAAVFAGACHYGAQLTTQGREAVVAWSFEGGVWNGQPLAGVDVVCAIAAPANLIEADAAGGTERRHSVVYVSKGAEPGARDAAVALVRERYARLLGEVREVRPAAIAFRSDERAYEVTVDGELALEGGLVLDRCCKMELQVWYAPFAKSRAGTAERAQLGERLGGGDVFDIEVGCSEVFRYRARRLGPVWERIGENNAFVGRFACVEDGK